MRRGSGIAGIVAGLVLCGGILDAHAQAPLPAGYRRILPLKPPR